MCDIKTLNRIERTVERKMSRGRMFTAFDITLALQKRGLKALHREIRLDIKRVADDLMWRFGYERTQVKLRRIGSNAFVYHPYGTDANVHRPSLHPDSLTATRNTKSDLTIRSSKPVKARVGRNILLLLMKLARTPGFNAQDGAQIRSDHSGQID